MSIHDQGRCGVDVRYMFMDPALTLPSPFFHTTFLLFSIVLLHHHHVFYCFPLPPPPQPHFYCFPSTTTTATTFQLFSFHNYWTRLSVSQTIDLLATDNDDILLNPVQQLLIICIENEYV